VTRVYLGLGSNLGDRTRSLDSALALLAQRVGDIVAVSSFYETEPWGVVDQPRFLNAACGVDTSLGPLALLATLQVIESALGRTPTVRYGPRTIDLDILLYGDLRLDAPALTIPHPGMLARSTVLVPLAEIAPAVRHPVTTRTIREHLADLGPTPQVALYPPGLAPIPSDEGAPCSPDQAP
jgi:2-amino-4-hydroxy-6-hydroxymethyldihydropteridine diphosphokinase